jgi:predicted DNA binding CopG/RHH family protein
MPPKKLSEAELLSIMTRALACADEPIPEMIFDPRFDHDPSLDFDIEDLPEPPMLTAIRDVIAPAGSTTKTTRICIRVPTKTLHIFKAHAANRGTAYQTLMNKVLKGASCGWGYL